MGIFRKHPQQTIPQQSPWAVSQPVYVVVFTVAAGLAYWWGVASFHGPATPSEASASIAVVRIQASEEAATIAERPDPDAVARKTIEQTAPELEKNLRIDISETLPNELRVSIRLTDTAPTEAVGSVNALAHAYAEIYRTEWKSQGELACQKARQTSATARRQYQEAKSQLDAFRAQQQAAQNTPLPRATQRPAPAVSPSLIDNPAWSELNQQLAVLRQERTKLLIDRTSAHPAVQEVESRIDAVRQQIATVPRQIPAEPAQTKPIATPEVPAEQPVAVASPTAAETAALRQLETAVAEAQHASETAAKAERETLGVNRQPPKIELALAEPPIAAPAPRSTMSTLFAALAAGVTTVMGLGMISAGASIEPPLTTVAQLESALHVPIIGVVPSTDVSDEPPTATGRPRLARWLLIFAGVLIWVGCAAMLALVRLA